MKVWPSTFFLFRQDPSVAHRRPSQEDLFAWTSNHTQEESQARCFSWHGGCFLSPRPAGAPHLTQGVNCVSKKKKELFHLPATVVHHGPHQQRSKEPPKWEEGHTQRPEGGHQALIHIFTVSSLVRFIVKLLHELEEEWMEERTNQRRVNKHPNLWFGGLPIVGYPSSSASKI